MWCFRHGIDGCHRILLKPELAFKSVTLALEVAVALPALSQARRQCSLFIEVEATQGAS
jgi:hypothetical protein